MPTTSNAAKLAAPSNTPKNLLLQELCEVLERLKKQQLPTSQPLEERRTDPAFPAQLCEDQMITVPADGLCLSHVCIAAFHARKWGDEHGEGGYRIRGDRSEQLAEEQQAHRFRSQVLELMREYAQFDQAREHYNQRANAIAEGAMPEDDDVPFYAACLNGCIEVVPLGFADLQEASVFGTGPLRISVGNIQQKKEDGAFVEHFILLQSWLPVEENLEKRNAFPFGVQACSTLAVLASADAIQDAASDASSSSAGKPSRMASLRDSTQDISGNILSNASQSSAGQPAATTLGGSCGSEIDKPSASALDSMNLPLSELRSRLKGSMSPKCAQQLLFEELNEVNEVGDSTQDISGNILSNASQRSDPQPTLGGSSANEIDTPSALALDSMNLTLSELRLKLEEDTSQTDAQQLLTDIPILERWRNAKTPSNEVRDAMFRLGKPWRVQQSKNGKKRPAIEVANELGERMLKKGKHLLTGSAAQPTMQSGGNPKGVSPAKSTYLRDFFIRQKRELVTETADGEGCFASKMPRLEHSDRGTSHADAQRDSAERLLQPAVPQQESQGSSGVPSSARDAQQNLSLKHLFRQLQSRRSEFPDVVIRDLLDSIPVLLKWKTHRKRQRDAMEKLSKKWYVARRANKKKRSSVDIAQDLETNLMLEATELLNNSGEKHAHWQILTKCFTWVQEQCTKAPSEMENKALTALLSDIQSWLEMRRATHWNIRKACYRQQRKAIKAELGALNVRNVNGTISPVAPEISSDLSS